MTITIDDRREQLWQWDTGRAIVVTGAAAVEVHISRTGEKGARVVRVENGVAAIPDDLLTVQGQLHVYVVGVDDAGRMTEHKRVFTIAARQKPDDYVWGPEELKHWEQLEERIETLESNETIDHGKLLNRDTENQHPISAITGLPDALDSNVRAALAAMQAAQDAGSAAGKAQSTADDAAAAAEKAQGSADKAQETADSATTAATELGKRLGAAEKELEGKQPAGDYLTSESDPTVPEWAKQPDKPTYTAAEVGALPDTTEIPDVSRKIDLPETLPTVGKYLRVKSVSADGVPKLEWAEVPGGGGTGVETWQGVRQLVRNGKAKDVFAIGDQLTCQRAGTTLTWDIIGIDVDTPADERFAHSLTLQLHDCINVLQYDAPEALYYCESALESGTYNFTLLSGYDVDYGGGKTYQFVLTKEVPAGGQIAFPWGYNVQASTVKVSTYKDRTDTTAIETVAVAEGAEGTNLGTADGNSTNMNHTHRIRYGSSNWKESAMRQWLNSAGAAGGVWTPQAIFDRPPAWKTNTAGFLNGLDADFLAVVGKTRKVTCRNTATDGGGSDTTEDRFFLLSRREMFAGDEIRNVIEGEPYPFYSDFSDLTAAGVGADANRIKYRNGSASYWWLRTSDPWSGSNVRLVFPSGAVSSSGASNAVGVAPACNII